MKIKLDTFKDRLMLIIAAHSDETLGEQADAILSAIKEAMPKELKKSKFTKSDKGIVIGWNAYRQELIKKLA